jgi:thermolysin
MVVLCAAMAAGATLATDAQQQPRPVTVAVSATGSTAAGWAVRAEAMLRDGTLEVDGVQADTMMAGRTHERLAQRHEGLPVFGGQLVRQRSGAAVVSLSGRLFENVSVPTSTPAIDERAARAIAEQQLGDGANGDAPVLGILASDDAYVLVYRLIVRSAWDVRRFDINAITGRVEGSQSELRHQGGVIGKGTGVLGDSKKVVARRSAGGFQTVDTFRPAAQFTYALNGSLGRFVSFFNTLLLFDSDLGFQRTNANWDDRALVDAHAYIGWTYDYYFKVFGRRGLDDRNFPLTAVVHPIARDLAFALPPSIQSLFVNNAFYLHPGLLVFGDGDGNIFNYLAGSLDVVAHELSHGVTAFTSNLEYQDESGALNEAFSDILGAGAEFHHIRPADAQKGPNWILAEDVTLVGPGFLRSMENPGAAGDPDHYSKRVHIGTDFDGGGVHINSGIINQAFYLAVNGGTNRTSGFTVAGVGTGNIERMLRIFYRGFTFYLTPFSQFSDARAATLLAASDLYGPNSNDRAQLLQAWAAVGVN